MMHEKDLLHTIGEIDDRFIDEAAPVGKRSHSWHRWAAAAAACLVLAAGVLLYSLLGGKPDATASGRYKYTITQREAGALVLRWEDRTLSERYLEMTLDEIRYCTRGLTIDPVYLGGELGICDAWGFDVYTDQTHHEAFPVFEITGIQDEKLVAVSMDGAYYVFRQDDYAPPATLGEFIEIYNLRENLTLTRFDYDDQYYAVEEDQAIWQILMECVDAPAVEDDFRVSGKHISFTATSEALGIYKRVFYITQDGYVKTNALDYASVYFIGEAAAGRIIDHALANASETEMEPYNSFLAGTITEIGDDYIRISDAILCWNESDGVEFMVLTTDPIFARWLKYHDYQVGDMVYIEYRGEVAEGNVIAGASFITEAMLRDGCVMIQG